MLARGKTAGGSFAIIRVNDDGEVVNNAPAKLGMWRAGPVQTLTQNVKLVLPDTACQEVKLIADHANSARIFLNRASETINETDCQDLEPSQIEVVDSLSNANEVAAFSLATGQKVRWMFRG